LRLLLLGGRKIEVREELLLVLEVIRRGWSRRREGERGRHDGSVLLLGSDDL